MAEIGLLQCIRYYLIYFILVDYSLVLAFDWHLTLMLMYSIRNVDATRSFILCCTHSAKLSNLNRILFYYCSTSFLNGGMNLKWVGEGLGYVWWYCETDQFNLVIDSIYLYLLYCRFDLRYIKRKDAGPEQSSTLYGIWFKFHSILVCEIREQFTFYGLNAPESHLYSWFSHDHKSIL